MNPLRIAIVHQAAGGGATLAAREILEWGPQRGHELSYHPGEAPASVETLQEALASFDPDIVHVHCWYGSYPYDLLSTLSGRHRVVLTLHDVFPVNQYGVECWECFRNSWCFGCPALEWTRRFRPNYRVVDRFRKRWTHRGLRVHLIYPSDWMRRRMVRSELGRWPFAVVPYSVDTDVFRPGEVALRASELPTGPLVLFAGHMYAPSDHRKGLPDLLEAWPQVRRCVPDAHLVVAGRVRAPTLPEGVVVLGERPRSELPDLYRAADVFALPSRGDNLPVAVIEALACGTPVVATTVGGIPEEVDEGATGLLVPPSDPARLAHALVVLLRDRETRQRFGVAARASAVLRFSRERSASAHEEVYAAALASERSRRED